MAKKTKENLETTIEASIITEFTISYWYDNGQELTDSDKSHIKECLEDGFTSGELTGGEGHRGWWDSTNDKKVYHYEDDIDDD